LPDIRSIQAVIRARLIEVQKMLEPLEAEANQLEKLAATFADDTAAGAPAHRPSAAHAATARRPRRPAKAELAAAPGRGKRAQQAVAKIREQPGITTAELADAMGISPNYLYRVLPRLEREHQVTKRGKGYHPRGSAGPAAATNGKAAKS
jgi:hypothetical protein